MCINCVYASIIVHLWSPRRPAASASASAAGWWAGPRSAETNINTTHCKHYKHYTIQYNTIQYNTIQYNTIQYNTIQYNTIQYNTIQYKHTTNTLQTHYKHTTNTLQTHYKHTTNTTNTLTHYKHTTNTIQYSTIQHNTIQYNAIQHFEICPPPLRVETRGAPEPHRPRG